MTIRWGVFKLQVDNRIMNKGIEGLFVVCAYCGVILKNPLKPIFANETQQAYCTDGCAKRDVIQVAEHMRETDPDWKGF